MNAPSDIGRAFPERYQRLLKEKVELTSQEFNGVFDGMLCVIASPKSHFRMRAEFRIWHSGNASHYAMYNPVDRSPVVIEDFSIGSTQIVTLMPALLEAIVKRSELRQKLYQVEFLTTLNGDALVSLIYHKPLDEQWTIAAKELQAHIKFPVIGRSRKQKISLERDYVVEIFQTDAGTLSYRQYETGFTQPNAFVCQDMLNWAIVNARPLGYNQDLLELYCGNGNFTLPLSKVFRRVLATEVSKLSTRAALENIEINNCQNIDLVRLSAAEVAEAIAGVREFRRLAHIDLSRYRFSTIFLDPPRAGLDELTLNFAGKFDNIIYVSCNPESLRQNLAELSVTHEVTELALFDQFPYTHHRECGVILRRK